MVSQEYDLIECRIEFCIKGVKYFDQLMRNQIKYSRSEEERFSPKPAGYWLRQADFYKKCKERMQRALKKETNKLLEI